MSSMKIGIHMSRKLILLGEVGKLRGLCCGVRTYSTQQTSSTGSKGKGTGPAPTPKVGSSSSSPKVADVQGLSQKVCSIPSGELYPGVSKSGTYKNPEYFCFTNMSNVDAEIEMLKYRLPRISNKTYKD